MKRHLQQPRPQQNMQNTVHQTALGKLAKYEVAKKNLNQIFVVG